jgi:hypothetical protein
MKRGFGVNYDDEILMAYADGELDPRQSAEIDAAIATDPGLARRVEKHRALRAKVSGAFTKVLVQPVPERLEHAARAGATPAARDHAKVIPFPSRTERAPGAPWRAREWTAMAASLVIGVMLGWRFLTPADSGAFVAGRDALLAGGELARALENQLASEQHGEEPVLIGLTFKALDGHYCRSFMLRGSRTAGLACRVGSDWQIPAIDSSPSANSAMQQASSAVTPAILRAIEARMDGASLDAEAERSARISGWSAPHD